MQSRQYTALSPWLAEFRNPAREAAFRAVELPRTLRALRNALSVAAAIILMFVINDYAFLGNSPAFYGVAAARTAVSLATLGFALSLHRHPWLLEKQWPLNLLIGIIVLFILMLVPLRPSTINNQLTAVVVSTLLFYLYVPNRLIWQTLSSLVLSLGFMLACLVFAESGWVFLVTVSMLLVMVNLAGFFTAQSLNRLRREYFAILVEQHETNLQLLDEVEQGRVMQEQLRQMAEIDHLTGLLTRGHFLAQASDARQRCQNQGLPMAICMLDLDHFKSINDRYGHVVGDQVLKQVSAACQSGLRAGDLLGRFGGEEFVAALPGADMAEAGRVAERLRACVEGLVSLPAQGLSLGITIGVAEVADHEHSLEPALVRADQALYRGKANGRNQVVMAS